MAYGDVFAYFVLTGNHINNVELVFWRRGECGYLFPDSENKSTADILSLPASMLNSDLKLPHPSDCELVNLLSVDVCCILLMYVGAVDHACCCSMLMLLVCLLPVVSW